MTQLWFDPNQYAWIPGTAFGVMVGFMGALVGWLAPRGRAKNFILRAWFTALAIAVVFLLAGMVALIDGQPWSIWYSLGLPGVIGTTVFGSTSVVLLKTYREAEERRLAAKDLL